MKSHYPIHKDLKSVSKITPPLYKPLLPVVSAGMKVMFPCKSDAKIAVKKYKVPGYEGVEIPVYVMEPKKHKNEKLPCLVLFHGGGFVFRASKAHYQIAKEYAWRVPCKVVYADYRLLPKHRFPVAVEDCFATYQWTLAQAEKLRIDSERIYIGGDSAGGNLAIAVTLMARDRNLPLPKKEVLIYPVTDRRMLTESMKKYVDTPVWNALLTAKMWKWYLGNGEPAHIEYASPMEAETLKNFPATYMEVAEYDCLRDEGIEFANRLKEECVQVELHEVKQACHGFETETKSSLSKAAMKRRIQFLIN